MAAYLAWNMAPLPIYRLGLISRSTYFHIWGSTMGWLLRGWTLAEAQALYETLADEQVMPNVRPDVLARLHWHQDQGHLVATPTVRGKFAAAVAFYPLCNTKIEDINTPLLVVIGEKDNVTHAYLCKAMLPIESASEEMVLKIQSDFHVLTHDNVIYHIQGLNNSLFMVLRDRRTPVFMGP